MSAITPKTDPAHAVVGHTFRTRDGTVWYCEAYEGKRGYWMVRAGAPRVIPRSPLGHWRRNVVENAIGRTFFRLSRDETQQNV